MNVSHWLIVATALSVGGAYAGSASVAVHLVDADGVHQAIGSIAIEETEYGLLFTPALSSLEAGIHGFHIHEHGNCNPADKDGKKQAAEAAGGHYDPEADGEHLGPYGEGHLGDLPALYVATDGTAEYPVLAPRLRSLDDIAGRSLMIHSGGDNHADHPEPLGGGGSRIACGVIP
ncbi:MAG TPA: superoxide dismutase [Cu-Zn] SodC [Porticoccaceae bacterium]